MVANAPFVSESHLEVLGRLNDTVYLSTYANGATLIR